MSDLTYRLEHEKPSRVLCVEGSRRIKDLEDALITLEEYFMIGKELPNKQTPLEFVMKSLKQK